MAIGITSKSIHMYIPDTSTHIHTPTNAILRSVWVNHYCLDIPVGGSCISMAVTVPLNPERPTLPSVLSSTERIFEELSYCVEDLCPLRVASREEGSQNLPLQISTVS